ncbi:MAG: prepilin-type N-terminal cleavage/methylation domain-containing protein [Sumerlaeia bacterium]
MIADKKRYQSKAVTLVELLIVVAIVAILAAIAVPNFLEAQTRAKVSAAQSNLRVLRGGLETYAVDYGRYPATRPMIPSDPLGLLANHQLKGLTTPIAYLGPSAFRDPFGLVQARAILPSASFLNGNHGDFPTLPHPNPERSVLYFHYPTLSARFQNPDLWMSGAAAISVGPDQQDSLGAYRPYPAKVFQTYYGNSAIAHPLDTVYDPTNGTVSEGDIGIYTGTASRFAEP